MEQDYTPTRKEVWREVWHGIRTNKTMSCLGYYTAGMLSMVAAPYIVPTSIRVASEVIKNQNKEVDAASNAECISALGGAITGLASWVAQVAVYSSITIEKKHPEVLLIPVATNLVSGIYEIVRGKYKKAEQRLIEKNNLSNLSDDRENDDTIETILETEK